MAWIWHKRDCCVDDKHTLPLKEKEEAGNIFETLIHADKQSYKCVTCLSQLSCSVGTKGIIDSVGGLGGSQGSGDGCRSTSQTSVSVPTAPHTSCPTGHTKWHYITRQLKGLRFREVGCSSGYTFNINASSSSKTCTCMSPSCHFVTCLIII